MDIPVAELREPLPAHHRSDDAGRDQVRSSVLETTNWETTWGPPEARGIRSIARGEAVFVDLGRGRHVIAILGWGPLGADTEKIYGLKRAALAPGRRVSWKDEPNLKGHGELPADYIPTLITFGDLNDPKNARVVRPDEFSRVFGEGVAFRRAMIETTTDSVPREIEKEIPFLTTHRDELKKFRIQRLGDGYVARFGHFKAQD